VTGKSDLYTGKLKFPIIMQKPWLIHQTNWKSVKETDYEVIVIPWGATEAHNYHLPYGTDNFLAEYVADKAGENAWQMGVHVGILPVIPFGVNTGQLDLNLTINLNPSTQALILRDMLDSLTGQGYKKFVVLNAHGGNDFRQIIRELQPRYPGCFICQMNWFIAVPFENYFDDLGEHAGEAETSAMMVIAPELLRPLNEAGDGNHKKLRFKARSEGWVWAPRPWSTVSKDTGIGNPKKSSPEKGKLYLQDAIQKMTDFFFELAKTSMDELYK
jgi:creatinine amidohydrolase